MQSHSHASLGFKFLGRYHFTFHSKPSYYKDFKFFWLRMYILFNFLNMKVLSTHLVLLFASSLAMVLGVNVTHNVMAWLVANHLCIFKHMTFFWNLWHSIPRSLVASAPDYCVLPTQSYPLCTCTPISRLGFIDLNYTLCSRCQSVLSCS